MKKTNKFKVILALLLLGIMVSLCGCSILNVVSDVSNLPGNKSESKVKTLKSWQFQHNSGTSDYSLFFSLLDNNDRAISASGTVDIRIEDEDGNILYSGQKSFTQYDFGNYSSELQGEQYLVNIRIKESELQKGNSSSGKVYLKVYNNDYYLFDEVNCSALYCLPVKDISVVADGLPKEVMVNSLFGELESKLKINEVSYSVENNFTSKLKIIVMGEKTYGKSNSGYDIISYKIYDHEGYVADSGTIMLYSLSKGDKFKDDSVVFYNAKPGENYTIKFFDYQY